ncbi:MAG: hypothetical protein JW809_12455 [Pirellulales bacterium]|nr:hypothetical protein [Pirellulales bacterium]
MDRFSSRLGRSVAALLVGFLMLAGAGCGPIMTAMYLAGGADTPADFNGLKKKKVAVVCRPLVQLKYRDMNASSLLARDTGRLLRKNVSKIEVIDHEKVEQWLDNNSAEDHVEIGRALGAEMVVAIDLMHFDIYQGATLYQGKANYTLTVYDCATGEAVYEKTPDQSVWPPNSAVPTSEKQESEFRRRFVGVLADEVARHFYAHDPRVNFAGDAAAL